MVLGRTFITDTGKPLHICSGLLGGRAQLVNLIGLLRRWSWKGHSSLTQGSLCMFIQVFPETDLIESVQWAYSEDGLVKGTQGSLCTFVQVFWETELIFTI